MQFDPVAARPFEQLQMMACIGQNVAALSATLPSGTIVFCKTPSSLVKIPSLGALSPTSTRLQASQDAVIELEVHNEPFQ
jgi:hypothetical protein